MSPTQKRCAVGVVAGLLVVVGGMWLVRTSVAEFYVVPTAAVAPEIPVGARVLVYKLDRALAPGQIVAYRNGNGQTWLGRVESVKPDGSVTLERNGPIGGPVAPKDIVGRVVLTTR